LLQAGRRVHAAVRHELATLAVAGCIQRLQHFAEELAGFLEHRIDRGRVDVRVRRQRLELALDVEQLVQHELHVAQRRRVLGHGEAPFLYGSRKRGRKSSAPPRGRGVTALLRRDPARGGSAQRGWCEQATSYCDTLAV